MKTKTWRSCGHCEFHNRQLYATRKIARQVSHDHHGRHKAPYRCTVTPGMWHVGDLSRMVIAGTRDRDAVYGDFP